MGGMVMPDGYTLGAGPITYNSKKYAKDNADIIKVTAVDSRGNSSTAELKVNIAGVFFQAYIASAKATREDGNGKKVRLECIGKISDYEIATYPSPNVTINYTVRDKNNTTTLQTGTVDSGNITYNEDNTFKVNGYIKGDLGAEGFTQDVEFIVNLTCAGQLFTMYPTNFNNILVDKGKILQDITEEGFAFGALYNTDLGGALQVNNARIDYNVKSNQETQLPYYFDNKRIYLKRFEFDGAQISTGYNRIPSGLKNITVQFCNGVAIHKNGASAILPSSNSNRILSIVYMKSNNETENDLELYTNTDWIDYTLYVNLYYTKND